MHDLKKYIGFKNLAVRIEGLYFWGLNLNDSVCLNLVHHIIVGQVRRTTWPHLRPRKKDLHTNGTDYDILV